jgi:HSP20 family molecular chaperone IbpA
MPTELLVQPEEEILVQTFYPVPSADDLQHLYDRIASRAFEIFEDNGSQDGRDLADWLQAEAEFVHPLHIGVTESPDTLTVRADVPGFKQEDLNIEVEPARVTISGSRETTKDSKDGKAVYTETCSNQILRVVDLPAKVDVQSVKTTVKDGVLELDLKKASPDKTDGTAQ